MFAAEDIDSNIVVIYNDSKIVVIICDDIIVVRMMK